MAFDGLAHLLAMDGHGPYVWTCYGLALAVAVANVLWIRRSRSVFFAHERAGQRREAARAQAEEQS